MDLPNARILARPQPLAFARTRLRALHLAAPAAGLSGCLLLAVHSSPRYGGGVPPLLFTVGRTEFHGTSVAIVAVSIVTTLVGLCLPRWWPHLLLVGTALAVPNLVLEFGTRDYPTVVFVVGHAAYPLVLLSVLACAQRLVKESPGWAAIIAGLAVGGRLFGSTMAGTMMSADRASLPTWHAVMVVISFLGLLPAVWQHRRGDPDAIGLPTAARWSGPRIRLVLAGTLAMCMSVPLSFLGTQRLSELLGISWLALSWHRPAEMGVIGTITLVIVLALAASAGLWTLGGALTAATVNVAVAAPIFLSVVALGFKGPERWLGALVGLGLGVAVAACRWRIPLAGALTVLAATTLFIANGGTRGHPEKLAQHTTPAILILVMVIAAAIAVFAGTAGILAPRGALPAALAPLAGVLATGGLEILEAGYLPDGEVSSVFSLWPSLEASASMLLVAGVGIVGLAVANLLAARRAERKHAEQIRREAADAERDRLARPIHDGVLQVLALVQRQGAELGAQGAQLAALAGEQEVALRSLLAGNPTPAGQVPEDLRTSLRALGAAKIEVTAPAEPVPLPAVAIAELTAAVQAALDNVRQHAGPEARTWILVEDEGDAVRVTVRDDGVGFEPQRLVEAATAGRLGVTQSIRGRVQDLGGTVTISSIPGEGTEVEFCVPRQRRGASS